jgi:hypothetical protein
MRPGIDDDPDLSAVPEWPEWSFHGEGDTRRYWLTRCVDKSYGLLSISGPLDTFRGYGGPPEVVYFASVSEFAPGNWGYGPVIHSVQVESIEELEEQIVRMKADLPAILAQHVL